VFASETHVDGNLLHAFDLRTGKKLWTVQHPGRALLRGAVASKSSLFTEVKRYAKPARDKVLDTGTVLEFDRQSGQIKKVYGVHLGYAEPEAQLAISGDVLVLGGGPEAKAVSLASGRELWRSPSGWLMDGRLLAEWKWDNRNAMGGVLKVRDLATGQLVLTASDASGRMRNSMGYSTEGFGDLGNSTQVFGDQFLMVGPVYCEVVTGFNWERKTWRESTFIAAFGFPDGKLQWVRQMEAKPIGLSPTTTASDIFANAGQRIILLNRRTGAVQWRLEIIDRPEAISEENGTLRMLVHVAPERLAMLEMPNGAMPPPETAVVDSEHAVNGVLVKGRQFQIKGRGAVNLQPSGGQFRALGDHGPSPIFRFEGKGYYDIQLPPPPKLPEVW